MKPLAVSMGDPAGIGLEIAARLWNERQARATPPFFLVGDADALQRAAARAGLPAPPVRIAATPDEIALADDAVSVLDVSLALEEEPGSPDPANARAIIGAIERGVESVRAGAASALVTLPIAKANLYRAGFTFAGHTEFVAHLTRDDAWAHARGPVMMLTGESLRVALATIHLPLARVPAALTAELIVQTGRVVGEALRRDFAIAAPRIALCGLNPHAGEHGELGREEAEIINPAAFRLRSEGWNVSDARPADSLFHPDARAGYDAVIAMYHDQGLIPLKTLHFWDGANITLGLPIVRTSPDHGVGFDLAGKGLARVDSTLAAMRAAWEMAQRRARA